MNHGHAGRSLLQQGEPWYVLRLYISGASPKSLQAVKNVKDICVGSLNGRYDLEVVDLYQSPSRAAEDQIVATPTLVKQAPLPSKRLIGTLSNADQVSRALGIRSIDVDEVDKNDGARI